MKRIDACGLPLNARSKAGGVPIPHTGSGTVTILQKTAGALPPGRARHLGTGCNVMIARTEYIHF